MKGLKSLLHECYIAFLFIRPNLCHNRRNLFHSLPRFLLAEDGEAKKNIVYATDETLQVLEDFITSTSMEWLSYVLPSFTRYLPYTHFSMATSFH